MVESVEYNERANSEKIGKAPPGGALPRFCADGNGTDVLASE